MPYGADQPTPREAVTARFKWAATANLCAPHAAVSSRLEAHSGRPQGLTPLYRKAKLHMASAITASDMGIGGAIGSEDIAPTAPMAPNVEPPRTASHHQLARRSAAYPARLPATTLCRAVQRWRCVRHTPGKV